MKKYPALLFMLLLVPVTRATAGPNDYPVTIHVSSCHLWLNTNLMEVDAVINGKKYVLLSPYYGVLTLGDYRAKLVRDEHKATYDSKQTYEFLFPDNKTRRYDVVGQSE
jgi:hypothetical protein